MLERWGSDPQSQLERGKAAGQLTAIGLAFVFIVGLVQSRYLFTVPEPTAESNALVAYIQALGRNLQAGGPGGEPFPIFFMRRLRPVHRPQRWST